MELTSSCFSLNTVFSVLLVFLLLNNGEAQQICQVANDYISIPETDNINYAILTIIIEEGVTLKLSSNPENAFRIDGQNLMVVKPLDYETLPDTGVLEIRISCEKASFLPVHLRVIVVVTNVNDNAPAFEKSQYEFNVNELTPVNTSVARVEAKDPDRDRLFYRLEPVNPKDVYFELQLETNPNILVKRTLDYDTIQQHTLILHTQDEPFSIVTSHTAMTTIILNIADVDNRPPWFQPCVELGLGYTKICMNSGYRGSVNLTEQAPGPLILEPGPVYAVDGDKTRNEEIAYRIIAGHEDGIFEINPKTGNITMLKPVDVPGPIILTILASQVLNSDQFSTTSVTFTVVRKSLHPPQFEKKQYKGYTSSESGLDSIVLEKNSNRPLRVQARDADFADGINPDLKYEVLGDSDFTVTADGFVLLKGEVMPGLVDLQIHAVDVSNMETGTANLIVHILPVGVSRPPGEYRMEDMATLGASLAAVVLLCLVIISLLIFRIKKGKADWQKLTEASIFRSSFAQGSSGPKDGMQYTNDGFQNDGDPGSEASRVQDETDLKLDTISAAKAKETSPDEAISVTFPTLDTFLHDSSSLAGSEKTDSEKGMKPILTKERKSDDGYKSVWFKEDIDPDAKEEVVIIPDNEERDAEDDDEDSFNIFSTSPITTPQMSFVGCHDGDSSRAVHLEDKDDRNSINT